MAELHRWISKAGSKVTTMTYGSLSAILRLTQIVSARR